MSAPTVGHTSKANGTGITSLNLTHDATGDDFLLAQIVTRGNVTGMTATYNGVSMTQVGSAVTVSAGAYAQQWVFKLQNPSTGSNTLTFSWTTSAFAGGMAVSYSGVSSVGQITQAAANLSASPTLTEYDMVVGVIAIPDTEANITTALGQTIDVVSAYSNQTGGGMNHNTGVGATTISATYGGGTEIVGSWLILYGLSLAPRLTAITNTEFLSSNAGSSLADISGNSRDLSASGTAAYENGYDGTSNTAFNMDGTWFPYRGGTFNITNTTNYTIQFRVKIDSQPGTNVTFCLFNFITNDGSGSRMNVRVAYQDSSGTKRLSIRDTGGNTQTYDVTLTTGLWYDMAYVQDQTNSLMKFYFKAFNSDTLIAAINVADSAGNSGNAVGLQIGSETTGGATLPEASNRGNFSIDNFRIVSAARTQSEIDSDFAAITSVAYVSTVTQNTSLTDVLAKVWTAITSKTKQINISDQIDKSAGYAVTIEEEPNRQ